MKQQLEFPSITPDAWAPTAPMSYGDEATPTGEVTPCPWGYEMMGAECAVEHVDGRRLQCRLLQWDPSRNRCLLRLAPEHAEVHLPLPLLRLVTLAEVLPPGSALVTGGWGAAPTHGHPQQYHIELDGGLKLSGLALNHVVRPEGLYLVRQVSEAGASMRSFMPTRAIVRSRFEPAALLPQADAMSAAALSATARMATDRAPRFEPVCSVNALLQAVELQARLPVRRLGDILLGMGLVTPEQLDTALAALRRDDSLPLGQQLVRQGLVSPENMQRALHLKMGYPCVDLKHFVFDRELLKPLPYKMAQELNALPLARTPDGRLVLALDDPGRLGLLKPLRVLFNAPLVAAIPWREPVQRMISEAYGVDEIGGLGQRWFG